MESEWVNASACAQVLRDPGVDTRTYWEHRRQFEAEIARLRNQVQGLQRANQQLQSENISLRGEVEKNNAAIHAYRETLCDFEEDGSLGVTREEFTARWHHWIDTSSK